MHPDTRSAIDADLPILLENARRAAENSYSPYSHFRVGAALKLSNGEIVTGTNVENVSFGPAIRVEAVAVANLNNSACPPCGACRQMLSEFINPEAPVAFTTSEGSRTMAFHEVLPLAFEIKLK